MTSIGLRSAPALLAPRSSWPSPRPRWPPSIGGSTLPERISRLRSMRSVIRRRTDNSGSLPGASRSISPTPTKAASHSTSSRGRWTSAQRLSTTICAPIAFLNSSRFPSIDFVSNSVAKINDHTVRVNGELTLLGVTRPLSVDVAVEQEGAGGAQKLAFLAKTNINRLEFGMNSGFPLVSRDVQLVISSAAVQL